MAIAFVVSLLLWSGVYAYMRWSTSPATVVPHRATQELPGQEPPAVVSLLANQWRMTEDAAEATLLDLAARRWLELRQPDADPRNTTVHLSSPPTGRPPLNPYETQVLDWVRTVSHNGVAPLSALTFRDEKQAKEWRAKFDGAVVEQARALGLGRARLGSTLRGSLLLGALIPIVLLLRILPTDGTGNLLIGFWLFIGFLILLGRPLGETDTPAGREAAARWLGVREFLRNDEAFAALPPAAVAVWDRYLAYGAALGTTHVASETLELGMGDRRQVWSSYTGQWRRVRIRYPRSQPFGRSTGAVLRMAALQVFVFGVFVLPIGTLGVWSPKDGREESGVSASGSLVDVIDARPWLFAAVTLTLFAAVVVRSLYLVVRALGDRSTPVRITGQVLWLEKSRIKEGEEKLARHYLAVDDGSEDGLRAWVMPPGMTFDVRVHDRVEVVAQPWSRQVLSVDRR